MLSFYVRELEINFDVKNWRKRIDQNITCTTGRIVRVQDKILAPGGGAVNTSGKAAMKLCLPINIQLRWLTRIRSLLFGKDQDQHLSVWLSCHWRNFIVAWWSTLFRLCVFMNWLRWPQALKCLPFRQLALYPCHVTRRPSLFERGAHWVGDCWAWGPWSCRTVVEKKASH